MPKRKPHISLASERLIKRVLKLNLEQFRSWPESVQELALSLAAEIFIIRYNPFIKPEWVYQSVTQRLEAEKNSLSSTYYQIISTCLENYWQKFQQDQEFKNKLVKKLSSILPDENIGLEPNTIAECSTDATDLRMELPLMVLFPETTSQIQKIVLLANEMNFSLIPRGGGSGLTGGAIPAAPRSVILSFSRMKKILPLANQGQAVIEKIQQFLSGISQRPQQDGGRQLAATVDANVDDILAVKFKIDP